MSREGLLKSISDGNAKRLSKLLRHGAGLKLTQDDMSASLFVAIRQSREECVESLLNAKTDPNSSDSDGKPALYLVMEYGRGNPVILKALLRAKANPNKVTYNTQQTALHASAKKGYQVCVKMLLLHGATVDKPDGYGNTALTYAAREGHITMLRHLLIEYAEPNVRNNNGETPLYHAVKANHIACVEELMSQGANPDICDNKGQNALLVALKMENQQLIDMLLDNKCSVNAQDTQTGKTVLHWAIQGGNLALVKKLLGMNADPNVRDKDWQTPFLLALNMDRKDILEHLLKAGCNISVTDRSFNTALHMASINGQSGMIHLLVGRGLAVDLKGSGGMTPLMLAAYGGHIETVDELLQYQAKSSLTDRNHASALVYAILSKGDRKSIHEIIKSLIRSNCDVNYAANLQKVTKTFGIDLADGVNVEQRLYTPLEISFLIGDPAVFMMLLRSGCDVSKFNCDRDATLHNFKSVHSDLRSRWKLLRCIQKDRKRLKPLKELCRRPVLETFKGNVEGTIHALPVSEQLKGFLNFSDLDDICAKYADIDIIRSPQSPPQSPLSPNPMHTNSLTRIKMRSTIQSSGLKDKFPKSPTTPVFPKATWDNESIVLAKKKTPTKVRASSFSEMPVTEKPERQSRLHSTSDVPTDEMLSPNNVTDVKSKSIFDFLRRSKPKSVVKNKTPKARSKKAKDPRDTISALLHGTNMEYRTSGEITPKPLDIEAIEHLNQPQDDYASVNQMLYGDTYSSTHINNDNDFDNRVRHKRADVTNAVNTYGVEHYINSEKNGNTALNKAGDIIKPYSKSNGPISSDSISGDDFFLCTNSKNDYHKINVPNTNAAPITNSLGRNSRRNKNKIELHSLLYGNDNNNEQPSLTKDQLTYSTTNNHLSLPNDVNKNHQTTGKFTVPINSSQSSVSSGSQYSYNEDNEERVLNNIQMDITKLAQNISSHYDNNSDSPTLVRAKYRINKQETGFERRKETIDPVLTVSYEHMSDSPLSPTSTTSKSSYESSSGAYPFHTGDVQLLEKYLHSQSPQFASSIQQQSSVHNNRNRPKTLDIFSKVGEFNGNHIIIDDNMSQSSIYSNPSCDSRNGQMHGKKNKTSSVSSLSSTDSKRSPSKIPLLQTGWSPLPVRASKIPVPQSPASSRAGSNSGSTSGRFVRSKSFRY